MELSIERWYTDPVQCYDVTKSFAYYSSFRRII